MAEHRSQLPDDEDPLLDELERDSADEEFDDTDEEEDEDDDADDENLTVGRDRTGN